VGCWVGGGGVAAGEEVVDEDAHPGVLVVCIVLEGWGGFGVLRILGERWAVFVVGGGVQGFSCGCPTSSSCSLLVRICLGFCFRMGLRGWPGGSMVGENLFRLVLSRDRRSM
jgi:hypothetical protein